MRSTARPFREVSPRTGSLLIPCIDVSHGRTTEPSAVPGLGDPGSVADLARHYCRGGARKVFLDVVDPWADTGYLVPLLREVRRTGIDQLLVSVGHGVLPSVEHAERLLDAGADVVSVSTSFLEEPETVRAATRALGGHRFMGVINSRRTGEQRWRACTHDGQRETSVDVLEVARGMAELELGALLANSLDREGTGEGFDIGLTRAVADSSGLPVIASGGCGTLAHLRPAVTEGRAAYVLLNKMLHAGRHSVAQVHDALLTSAAAR
ncbi:HisA/HisF-related TIM barrel protein [Streptomyces qinglanensis]|uniref:Cyclase n=1 Tax=Streptomyces qinglanensis TaxID=943816 RepID=A0A1H9R8L7_9ACTN|nr:HisA/HisF-related TIM barrel protein [Streptomyces qinglanensis]SER69010.1 cyclase [Streptomyces qinglanensis]